MNITCPACSAPANLISTKVTRAAAGEIPQVVERTFACSSCDAITVVHGGAFKS